MSQPIVAFCNVPHIGGIYSVYQRLRRFLQGREWDVRCVYTAAEIPRWRGYSPDILDDGCLQLDAGTDLIDQSQRLVQWVTENNVAIVLPMSSQVGLSAVPPSASRDADDHSLCGDHDAYLPPSDGGTRSHGPDRLLHRFGREMTWCGTSRSPLRSCATFPTRSTKSVTNCTGIPAPKRRFGSSSWIDLSKVRSSSR